MTSKKTLAGFGATAMLMAGVDASVLAVEPIERSEVIAQELVESKQIDNTVETNFPWKDQTGIKVKYDMGEPTLSEKFKDKRNKEVITETVDFGDGGFKVDILLNEKPNTNVFCYQIEGAENYDFFYQPPLTAEEIAEGAERPENIEGSYAVYHKTLKNHREGAENYATGKVMHIPRPQVWELNNQASTTEWADLSYNEKDGLCVKVQQEFLDNATYPVRVDPTFGYTSIGASQANSALAGDPLLCIFSLSESGDVSKLTHYTKSSAGAINTKGLIYDDDGGSSYPGTLMGITDIYNPDTTFGWDDATFSSPISLITGSWWLGFVPETTSVYQAFDTGSTNQQRYLTASQYTTPSNPFTAGATGSNRKTSIYATYTASASSSAPTDAGVLFE